MIAPVDPQRHEENDARMRLGIAAGGLLVAVGLTLGVVAAAVIALTACLYVFFGHTALARARAQLPAAAAE
ncbi:MAG: hypothetical protein QMD73_11315, partial [Rhodocyclaceae bacterium]|nr:hypothetical protein [Rhodocyclaceae bacterium]